MNAEKESILQFLGHILPPQPSQPFMSLIPIFMSLRVNPEFFTAFLIAISLLLLLIFLRPTSAQLFRNKGLSS